MKTNKRRRLKRCPFCKSKATMWNDVDGFWYVGCREGFCGVSPYTSGQATPEEAADTWNYRAVLKKNKG